MSIVGEESEARLSELREALEESVKLQSHYAELLNMYDGGRRLQFADVDEWLARLDFLRKKKEKL